LRLQARGSPLVGSLAKKVAGRKRWYEEATHTAPEPAEPHGTQEMRRT